jgi:hypothetical protein
MVEVRIELHVKWGLYWNAGIQIKPLSSFRDETCKPIDANSTLFVHFMHFV